MVVLAFVLLEDVIDAEVQDVLVQNMDLGVQTGIVSLGVLP